ncbi:ABC transporter ATP-binding protein [Roseovarius pacificus]|uniref:ABC transporter ATP-binding protein n=1 Tax=Roseovarius pacificus TaxID=337701 RepID=UPI002A187277|nr:ABC transporter ATP-binding protein [Roseovarius pacificus]
MIEIEKVTAGYGDGPDILHGINLNADGGEIVTILGPNGCGKSTLLKTIAGFVKPRSGRVLLNDTDLTPVPANEKVRYHRMGFVPQSDNIFRTLTVAENIAMGARFLPKAERAAAVQRQFKAYSTLADKANRKASALSGGERQLLSLARALVSNPTVLLLDEPSAGLSPAMVHEVFEAIADIRDRTGMCIVMVEQNAFEALGVADRAYVLALGQVALEGRAKELLADPAMRHLYLGGEPEATVTTT